MQRHAIPTTEQAVISLLSESLLPIVGSMNEAARSEYQHDSSDPRDESVKAMLLRSSDLARGCVDLGRSANAIALSIMARAALENLILLLWLIESDQNPSRLEEEGRIELARAAAVNFRNGKARVLNKYTDEDATKEFLASDRFSNLPRRISVEQRAKEAHVEDLYNVFYRFLSMEMHGHEFDDATDGPETLVIMHLQGIGAILKGTELVGYTWLRSRTRIDNEALRKALGFE